MPKPVPVLTALLLAGLPLPALQAQASPSPQLAQARMPIPIPMQTAPWPSAPWSSERSGPGELIQPVAINDINLCPASMREALMAAGRAPGLLFQRSCNCYAQQRLDGAIEPEAVTLCLP